MTPPELYLGCLATCLVCPTLEITTLQECSHAHVQYRCCGVQHENLQSLSNEVGKLVSQLDMDPRDIQVELTLGLNMLQLETCKLCSILLCATIPHPCPCLDARKR